MSTFENYDVTCEDYDTHRRPMATEIIGNLIEARSTVALKDLRLLDAGCGTGNYARALLRYGVGHVTLLDASKGMLTKARKKLEPEIKDGRVDNVVQAVMPSLPFKDAMFDAVLFNLALHHLDHQADGEHFPAIQKTLTETFRVLKPGGIVSITSIKASWMFKDWFVTLHPSIAERYAKILPSSTQWEEMLTSAGFRTVDIMTVYHKLPAEVYNARRNPKSPLDIAWRNTDSYWAFATEQDLIEIERKIQKMTSERSIQRYIDEHDKLEGYYRVLLVMAKNKDVTFVIFFHEMSLKI